MSFVCRVDGLRRFSGFYLIQPTGVLRERRGCDGKQAVRIPTRVRYEPDHSTSPDDVATGKSNEVLIAAQRPAEEDPVPPGLIGF